MGASTAAAVAASDAVAPTATCWAAVTVSPCFARFFGPPAGGAPPAEAGVFFVAIVAPRGFRPNPLAGNSGSSGYAPRSPPGVSVKLLLPVSVLVFAAGACCCCGGDLAEQLEKEGINVPDVGGVGAGTGTKAHASVPAGEKVKILDIGPDDAYVADKATIIGKTCVTDTESTYYDGDWHGGGVHCTDGSTYYFYNAAYEDLGPNPGGPIGAVAPTPTTPTPPGGPPPAGATLTELPSGSRVKILDVAPDDAYYSDKASIIGKTCTLQDTSSVKDGGWHGGQIGCDDGSSYYFYKAAYQQQ